MHCRAPSRTHADAALRLATNPDRDQLIRIDPGFGLMDDGFIPVVRQLSVFDSQVTRVGRQKGTVG
jgi:hypothetical protein